MSLETKHKAISIEALKSGDQTAFQELVEQYKDAVLNICFGFIQNAEDAEDIAQEVFVEVYRSLENFREDSSLYTWIYRIATSKSLDELRKRKRLKRKAFYSAQTADHSEDFNLENIKGESSTPEQKLIQKQQKEAIFAALDRIPEKQRIAFTLSNFQHLSYKEIADVMEKSASSVESLLHRAKISLRKELESFYKQQME